jgi:hypothetical protein
MLCPERRSCDGRKLETSFCGEYLEPDFEEEAKGVGSDPMDLFLWTNPWKCGVYKVIWIWIEEVCMDWKRVSGELWGSQVWVCEKGCVCKCKRVEALWLEVRKGWESEEFWSCRTERGTICVSKKIYDTQRSWRYKRMEEKKIWI